MAKTNLGNQIAGASNVQCPPGNNKAVCRFQNTSAYPIAIDKLYCSWALPHSTAKLKPLVYSDVAGLPDALLGEGNERVGVVAGWNVLTFPIPVIVQPGEFVWLGTISDTMLTGGQCSVLTGGIKYNANPYAPGPSATFGAASTSNYLYRILAEGDDLQPRFGRASIDSGSGNYQPDREHGEPFVLGGTDPVPVDSISTYIKTTSATVRSKAAIFSDAGGMPGIKLAQTEEVIGSSANAWLRLPFTSPYALAPGTYWLCFICSENLVTPTIPVTGLLRVDGSEMEATAFQGVSNFLFQSGAPSGIDIYASYAAGPKSMALSASGFANLPNAVNEAIGNHLLRSSPWAKPVALYAALFTTLPGDDGTGGIEAAMPDYGRVFCGPDDAAWLPPVGGDGTFSNAAEIAFNAPAADWGVVVGVGLYDAATGGTLQVYLPLTSALNILSGDPAPYFPEGALELIFA